MKRQEPFVQVTVSSILVEHIDQRVAIACMFSNRPAPGVMALQGPAVGETLAQFDLHRMIGRVCEIPGDTSLRELRIADDEILRKAGSSQQFASSIVGEIRVVEILRETANVVIRKEI